MASKKNGKKLIERGTYLEMIGRVESVLPMCPDVRYADGVAHRPNVVGGRLAERSEHRSDTIRELATDWPHHIAINMYSYADRDNLLHSV